MPLIFGPSKLKSKEWKGGGEERRREGALPREGFTAEIFSFVSEFGQDFRTSTRSGPLVLDPFSFASLYHHLGQQVRQHLNLSIPSSGIIILIRRYTTATYERTIKKIIFIIKIIFLIKFMSQDVLFFF
jgi:hypothetical protein